ncbi:MAG TPA: hypothetical protein DCP90_00795 [Clostridiales bacterium]|nr:MAG: hypothetical protein A2Y22_07945 [Clostridiales bacterium GWD2_32_59]HAN09135.1 hypothetical protein [Clostridiales bacterium]
MKIENQKFRDKNKGFTLLELIAVLVILAALATIAIPIFINKSDEAKQVAHNTNLHMLRQQAQMYMLSHEPVADSADIIDAMVTEGFIKDRPTYPINSLNTYAVEVVSGKATVKLNGPVAPTLGITADTADTTNAASITYTFTFSASVTNFDITDVTVTNGTKGAFAGSGAVYTLVVTNTGVGVTQSISVADGAATSTVGGLESTSASKNIVLANTGESLVVGNYIKFGKYNGINSSGAPIVWRVINKTDIDSNGTQDLMLLSDRIITMKSYDAKDAAEADADRKNLGSNNWLNSNIREWLNSTAGANSVVYSTQKPDSTHVFVSGSAVNPYDTEAGFLNTNNFSNEEYNKIVSVINNTIVNDALDGSDGGSVNHGYDNAGADESVAAGTNYNTAYYITTTDKIFLPSLGELATYVDGELTHPSTVTDYLIAYTTPEARTQSNYGGDPANDTVPLDYWTRDAYPDASYITRLVYSDGMLGTGAANRGYYGIRPVLYLNSSNITLGAETGATASTAYTITGLN